MSGSTQVPSLESLAGEWLGRDEVMRLPAVSNFWGAVGAGDNVAGVQLLVVPPYTQGGSTCEVTFDGVATPWSRMRWSAYEITRLARTPTGLWVRTATRLAFEDRQLLLRIEVGNPSAEPVSTTMAIGLDPRVRKYTSGWAWEMPRPDDHRFTARVDGPNLVVADDTGPAVSAFACSPAPDTLTADGSAGSACWQLDVAPGETRTVELVLAFGDGNPVLEAANATIADFGDVFDDAASKWSARWRDAFDPENGHYSGSLPVLATDSPAIDRLYYMSALSLLMCERTNFGPEFNELLERPPGGYSGFDRVYVTAAPEYASTVTYFWDTSHASVLMALLDPEMVRTQTSYWLDVDIYDCYAIEILTGGTVGPWYSANDLTVSTTILNYVKLTGDWDHLGAAVAGTTVLQALENCATHWRELVAEGQRLADYGWNDNLMEVLPRYVNQVVSFNAANVWLMREVADLRSRTGDQATADVLTKAASDLLADVLALYVPGEGVWNCRHADGELVPVRTVMDFITAGNLLADDLTPTQRTEMAEFVGSELLHADWMRALSLRDSQAPVQREDHGTTGAFDAWPALTAQTFAKFGDYTALRSLLETFSKVTRCGPFSQAHQFTGDPTGDSAVNASGVMTYLEQTGASFAGVVITDLFGWCPDGRLPALTAPDIPRGITGTLSGLRFAGATHTITSGLAGLDVE